MKIPCSLCSAPGRDHCPALNNQLCGSCCAHERNRTIECTADCKHNPFGVGNYDAWLRIDTSLTSKKTAYSKVVLGMMSDDDRSYDALRVASSAAVYYLFFSKAFKDGKTVAQLWQEEGWTGLDMDQVAMMKYRMNSAPALVEVRKILDSQSMECFDMLDPERGAFVMYDRTLARTLPRYTRLWMWLAKYPYYSRPACDPLEVPQEIYWPTLNKMLSYIIEECDKNKGTANRSKILGKKFGEYVSFIKKETHKAYQAKLRNFDFHSCKAFYAIKTKKEDIKKVLDLKPDFRFIGTAAIDEAPWPALSYHWFCQGESKEIESKIRNSFRYDDGQKTIMVLGGVFLGEKEVMVHSTSRVNFDFIKKMVEHYWGKSLEYRREAIVDMAQQLADRTEREGQTLVLSPESKVPLTEHDRKLMTADYLSHYEHFSNVAMKALDGMTPMDAAKNVKMRSRLIEFMKGHIHHIDTINKAQRLSVDISFLLKELGLNELL